MLKFVFAITVQMPLQLQLKKIYGPGNGNTQKPIWSKITAKQRIMYAINVCEQGAFKMK